eukprot:gene3114-5284_t
MAVSLPQLMVIVCVFKLVSTWSVTNFVNPTSATFDKIGNFTGATTIHDLNIAWFSTLGVQFDLESANKENYIAFAPTTHKLGADVCNSQLFQRVFNKTLNLSNPNMCEDLYCNDSVFKLKNISSWRSQWIFFHCHLCLTRYNERFVQRVKNGSCSISDTFFEPWKKCGKLMENEGDIVPHFDFLCYSKSENRYLMPFREFIGQSIVLVSFSILSVLIVTLTLVSFLPDLLEFKKKKTWTLKLKFLCSLKNQIIFLAVCATFIPLVCSFISMFIELPLETYGCVISQFLVSIQFVQIATIWSFVLSKSKKFKLKGFTKGHLAFLFGSIVVLFIFAVFGIAIFGFEYFTLIQIRAPPLFAIFSLVFNMLIGIWVMMAEISYFFISVVLWIYTIRMFKILSVTKSTFKEKLKFFFQLRFSQLTLILNISNFFTMGYVIWYIIARAFPGTFTWELTFIAPYLLYIGLSTNILVILFGMTNWKNILKIYCFACKKNINDDDTEDEDDKDEKNN